MRLRSVIALTYPRSFYTFSIDRPAIEKVFWTVTWEAAMYRLAMVILSVAPAVMAGTIGFVQTNLASDVPGLAQTTDPDLVNAWGMAASATSPVWIGANGSGKSVLYNGAGVKQGLVVAIPGDGSVTGLAFSGLAGSFNADSFLFASEDGTVSGWRGALGTSAETLEAAPPTSTKASPMRTSAATSSPTS